MDIEEVNNKLKELLFESISELYEQLNSNNKQEKSEINQEQNDN